MFNICSTKVIIEPKDCIFDCSFLGYPHPTTWQNSWHTVSKLLQVLRSTPRSLPQTHLGIIGGKINYVTHQLFPIRKLQSIPSFHMSPLPTSIFPLSHSPHNVQNQIVKHMKGYFKRFMCFPINTADGTISLIFQASENTFCSTPPKYPGQ